MTVSRCTTKIGRRSDGLHALIACDVTQWPAMTYGVFWKGTEAPVVSPIPIPDFMAKSEAYVEWLNQDTLLVVDQTQASMRTTELSYPALQVKNQWTWGDAISRWGMSWRTTEGGVACCVCADPAPSTDLWIDLAYRAPDLPIPSQQTTWYQRFKFPPQPSTFGHAKNVGFCQGTDGLLYAFCVGDGAGALSMTRWQKGPGASWLLVDHDSVFIPRDVPASICGEQPTVTAMPDPINKRIVLGYQTWAYRDNPACPSVRLQSYVILTAIYPDKRVEVLGKGDWWSSHVWFPRIVPWPRRDGVYLIAQKVKDDCSAPLLPAYFRYAKPDKIYPDAELTNSYQVQAFGDDGWFVTRDNDNDVTLTKIRFRPELSVKNAGSNVQVSWDESMPNDQFYTSLNQEDFTAGQIGVSPATVTKDVVSKWFKVKQSP